MSIKKILLLKELRGREENCPQELASFWVCVVEMQSSVLVNHLTRTKRFGFKCGYCVWSRLRGGKVNVPNWVLKRYTWEKWCPFKLIRNFVTNAIGIAKRASHTILLLCRSDSPHPFQIAVWSGCSFDRLVLHTNCLTHCTRSSTLHYACTKGSRVRGGTWSWASQ